MTYHINHDSIEHRTPLFTVKRANITFPDGVSREYDHIDIQNAVAILPLDEDGNIHFVQQFRVGSEEMMLELPAGKIEAGEDPFETARRELREETGFAANSWEALGGFFMTPGYSNEYMYCYLARGLYRDPLTPDVDEFLNLVTIPLTTVLEMVDHSEFEDGKTLALLMLSQRFWR